MNTNLNMQTMTVLKGSLAIQQSKALIRTFRAMKDYAYRGDCPPRYAVQLQKTGTR